MTVESKKKKIVAKKAVSKKAASPKAATKKTAAKKAASPSKKTENAVQSPYPSLGTSLPTLSLFSDSGEKISLKDFKGRNVILYFYPKDDTPGCTKEACDFRDSLKALKSRGVIVLGVSKDSVESHGKFVKKYSLNFPLLADVEGKLCEALGVWQEKSNYGKKYMGIVRTTFLIDSNGKIAKIYPKVRVEGHVSRILEDLAQLGVE